MRVIFIKFIFHILCRQNNVNDLKKKHCHKKQLFQPTITITSTGSVQSWPKGYFLLLLRLMLKNCPSAEELRNNLYMLHTKLVVSRSSRITCRCYICNLKSLAQVYVLECCRTAAVLLQRCCRPTAALLKRSCRITYRC